LDIRRQSGEPVRTLAVVELRLDLVGVAIGVRERFLDYGGRDRGFEDGDDGEAVMNNVSTRTWTRVFKETYTCESVTEGKIDSSWA
jgi:hypothetical protein